MARPKEDSLRRARRRKASVRLSSQPKRSCNDAAGSSQASMGCTDQQRSESPTEHIPNVDLSSFSMSNQVDKIQFSCDSRRIIESLLTGISPSEPVAKDAVTRPVRGRATTSAERMRTFRERRRNVLSELPESVVSAMVGTSGRLTNLQSTVPTTASKMGRNDRQRSESPSEHIPNVDLPSSSMSDQVDKIQFSCESGRIIES